MHLVRYITENIELYTMYNALTIMVTKMVLEMMFVFSYKNTFRTTEQFLRLDVS